VKRVFVFSGLAAGFMLAALPASAIPATGMNWSGFYAGATAGLGGGSWTGDLVSYNPMRLITDAFPNGAWQGRSVTGYGWLGGAEVGFNSQMSGFMWGLEGDVSASGVNGSGVFTTRDFLGHPAGANQEVFDKHIQANIDWLGTVRLRAGVLVNPGTLLYGTGGLAVGGTSSHQDVYFDGGNFAPGLNYSGSDTSTQVGWTIGVGLEQKLSSHWSLKAEYLYADLGTAKYHYYGTYTGYPYGGGPTADSDDGYSPHLTVNIVRVGFNYAFGG